MKVQSPTRALNRMASIWSLAAIFVVTFGVAVWASIASINAPTFYAALNKPIWAPPAALFGPAWTVLYSMMSVAAWLVLRTVGWRAARTAMIVYLIQLVLNGLWSWLFFGWHWGAAAMVEVVMMWIAIVYTMMVFYRIQPLAALWLVPYLGWVSFASLLNLAVWQMNPQLL